MQASQIPDKVPLPFANSGTKTAIPTASQIGITAGAASLTDGFPPLTFTPIASGGVPPSGADFNGILNLVTAVQQWQSAGGIFKYDTAFSTSIGGYPKGAILMSSTNASTWLNLVDNNTTDPDAGGANWISLSAGRLINVQKFTAGGTYTPSAGMKTVIVEVQGGGGGGGGAAQTGAGQVAGAFGGAGGAFGRGRFTVAQVGASLTVTVGNAGSGGAAGANAGSPGGTSSFGGLLSAPGGSGGSGGTANTAANSFAAEGGPSGAPSGANLLAVTGRGSGSVFVFATGQVLGAAGGASFSGPGAPSITGTAGASATNAGAGGSGAAIGQSSGASYVGGAGAAGYVTIYEYA